MISSLVWDEAKRSLNLVKHGLDFAEASEVLHSRYRLDIEVIRAGERRVHTARDGATRIISFRPASTLEREAYHAWLENE